MNEALLKEITDAEIKAAASSVKGSSAPGEDGLTGVFYRNYWHIVGLKVTEEVRSFFCTSPYLLAGTIPSSVSSPKLKSLRP